MTTQHAVEVQLGKRFEFGKNWASYSELIDEDRIRVAEESLVHMLDQDRFEGTRVLDIGSGSGLFSLAFRRLGADVVSFDFDPASVGCTRRLQESFFPNDDNWKIMEGSVLDRDFVDSLGTFDIVYSWGVLHHTGSMWEAVDNAIGRVGPKGRLFIGLYRDYGWKSNAWHWVKKTYCSSTIGRWAILSSFVPYYLLRGLIEDIFRFKNPVTRYREHKTKRGMSRWHDWVDWLGGYPYEFTTLERMKEFVEARGFRFLKTSNRHMVEGVFEKLDNKPESSN